VTWVGIDGYYFSCVARFGALFGPAIATDRALTRDPILISETGVAPTADRTTRISNLFAGVRTTRLLGLVWFDARGEPGLAPGQYRGSRRVPAGRQGLEDAPVMTA
jgi:mannan endo-1,4-beta-mannosidase